LNNKEHADDPTAHQHAHHNNEKATYGFAWHGGVANVTLQGAKFVVSHK
jgi:hypothetical protein